MICEDRWGWSEVKPIKGKGKDGTETECVEEGKPIPAGWRKVD